MMDRKPTLSDLLALRDAGSAEPRLAAAVEADAESRETLARLRRIKAELNRLPAVEPDPAVWQAIEGRIGKRRRRFAPVPLAAAASVLLALTVGLLWREAPPPRDPASARVSSAPYAVPVSGLIERSQRLESALYRHAAWQPAGGSSSGQSLVYAIADIDARLSALYDAPAPDPAEQQRLWAQRVALLESLADLRYGEARAQRAVYFY